MRCSWRCIDRCRYTSFGLCGRKISCKKGMTFTTYTCVDYWSCCCVSKWSFDSIHTESISIFFCKCFLWTHNPVFILFCNLETVSYWYPLWTAVASTTQHQEIKINKHYSCFDQNNPVFVGTREIISLWCFSVWQWRHRKFELSVTRHMCF